MEIRFWNIKDKEYVTDENYAVEADLEIRYSAPCGQIYCTNHIEAHFYLDGKRIE